MMIGSGRIDLTGRTEPRVALVHDFLSQQGGAERVVLHLAAMFPDAPIYTSFFDAAGTFPEFQALDVRTSHLQGHVDPSSFRRDVLRFPSAFRRLDLSEFDLVVASSSAFAHHVEHPNLHVYCHTPPRFLYQVRAYLDRRFGMGAFAPAFDVASRPLRRADRAAAERAASYIANSRVTAARLRQVYGIDAPVVYPPVWTAHLPEVPPARPATRSALVVSRLLPYKRVDVALRACARVGIPVTVAGDGPERARLEALGGPGATFVGSVTDAQLASLVADHAVVVVPSIEDFGLVPLEANYCGRPVVAPAAGGALETVRSWETGVLVDMTADDDGSWADAIDAVLRQEWDVFELRRAAEAFSHGRFTRQLRAQLGLPVPAAAPEVEVEHSSV